MIQIPCPADLLVMVTPVDATCTPARAPAPRKGPRSRFSFGLLTRQERIFISLLYYGLPCDPTALEPVGAAAQDAAISLQSYLTLPYLECE